MTTPTPAPATTPTVRPGTVATTRREVHKLLSQSDAFKRLPLEQQQQIAHDTVLVGSYLAEPPAESQATPRGHRDPYDLSLADPGSTTTTTTTGGTPAPGGQPFVAGAAREGAAVAGALLAAVNFPTFVASLIKGVFHAIVQASIEQMEAYGKLVADVAKTLNQFRDENTSDNEARDNLVDQFPDTFKLDIDTGDDGAQQPRVRLREGVDEQDALRQVQGTLPAGGEPVRSLDDDTIEEKLVPAMRTQLATSRQQLLATMVMMGINRIVVTDGRIAAKVMYDFSARDNLRRNLAQTTMKYGDQYKYSGSGESESNTQGAEVSRDKDSEDRRDASYYSKGKYQYAAEPVLTLVSTLNEQTDAALTTKASLAGSVDINFKSDYFPLEKMADSFQISQIQNAAKPGQQHAGAGGGGGGGAAAPAQGAQAQRAPAAQQPAQAPASR